MSGARYSEKIDEAAPHPTCVSMALPTFPYKDLWRVGSHGPPSDLHKFTPASDGTSQTFSDVFVTRQLGQVGGSSGKKRGDSDIFEDFKKMDYACLMAHPSE